MAYPPLTGRADFLSLLPPCSVGAEVGVQWGDFTCEILEKVRPAKLHLIDPWWLINPGGPAQWAWEIAGRKSTYDAFISVLLRFRGEIVNRVLEFHVGFSEAQLSSFPDCYFDWIYLDTTHKYKETRQELAIMSRKIKENGIILGHDWRSDPTHKHHGVYRAVTELMDKTEFQLIGRDQYTQWAIRRARFVGGGG